MNRILLVVLSLLAFSSCTANKVVDVKSPCVSNEFSKEKNPCGPRKPINDWWLNPQVQS